MQTHAIMTLIIPSTKTETLMHILIHINLSISTNIKVSLMTIIIGLLEILKTTKAHNGNNKYKQKKQENIPL